MKKFLSATLLAALVLALSPVLLADSSADLGGWTGTITDSKCGGKTHPPDCAEKCVKKGAKWALYSPADKQTYILSNQEEAAKMANQEVTVKGKLDSEKKTIEVSSMEPTAKK